MRSSRGCWVHTRFRESSRRWRTECHGDEGLHFRVGLENGNRLPHPCGHLGIDPRHLQRPEFPRLSGAIDSEVSGNA